MRIEEILNKLENTPLNIGDNVLADVRKYFRSILNDFEIIFSNPTIDYDSLFISATITVYGEDGKHSVTAIGAQPLKEGNRYIANSTRFVQADALKNACLLLGAGGDVFAETFSEKKGKKGGTSAPRNSTRGSEDKNIRSNGKTSYTVQTVGPVRDCRLKLGAKQIDIMIDGAKLNLIFWADVIEALGNTFTAFVDKAAKGSVTFQMLAKDNRPQYEQLIFQEFVK